MCEALRAGFYGTFFNRIKQTCVTFSFTEYCVMFSFVIAFDLMNALLAYDLCQFFRIEYMGIESIFKIIHFEFMFT